MSKMSSKKVNSYKIVLSIVVYIYLIFSVSVIHARKSNLSGKGFMYPNVNLYGNKSDIVKSVFKDDSFLLPPIYLGRVNFDTVN